MEFEDIKTFLSVVSNQSISKAADALYLGQGTVSSRLQRLENELGTTLIQRQAGIRTIQLTPEGEAFVEIAKEWLSLEKRAKKLKGLKTRKELRLAATNALNHYMLDQVYSYFMSEHPEIELFLQTEHSNEIHQLIERQEMDAGFVTNLHRYPNVTSKHLFSEDLVLLCQKDHLFLSSRDFKDLDPEDEVYMIHSAEYETWHQHIFMSEHHKITIGTLSMIEDFIIYPQSWAIIPYTAADRLTLSHQNLAFTGFEAKQPPQRKGYILFPKNINPWVKESLDLFIEDFYKINANNPHIDFIGSE